jgi:hypothetical protein
VSGPPRMTSPGAVCPATVRYGLEKRKSAEVTGNNPATRNTQVRAPAAITHARSDPAPESLRLVTSMTVPPRPPTEAAPPPCAPGNAAGKLTGGIDIGVGAGTAVGVGVGARDGQVDTVITGTVPADENATVQTGGARTSLGTV